MCKTSQNNSAFYVLSLVEKMKNLQALVNEANKKVAAKKRRKVVPFVDQLMAGSGSGSTLVWSWSSKREVALMRGCKSR